MLLFFSPCLGSIGSVLGRTTHYHAIQQELRFRNTQRSIVDGIYNIAADVGKIKEAFKEELS
jgi:hypothetical protein